MTTIFFCLSNGPSFELSDVQFENACLDFKYWRRGQVVSSLPATKDTGAKGREIEFR
jgi:hypothetical protein